MLQGKGMIHSYRTASLLAEVSCLPSTIDPNNSSPAWQLDWKYFPSPEKSTCSTAEECLSNLNRSCFKLPDEFSDSCRQLITEGKKNNLLNKKMAS
jgi:hypothetical protein